LERAFLKQPLAETLRGIKETTAQMVSGGFTWIKDMCKKIRTQPQKYPDYVMDGEALYRIMENVPPKVASEKSIAYGHVELLAY